MADLFAPSIFYTADLHLGHTKINELAGRPFDSVEEMNHTLIANWNDRVAEHDIVWVLGDLALGPIDESLELARQLNGHKMLICGNHDRAFHGYPHPPAKPLEHWAARYRAAGFRDIVTGEATHRTGSVITVPLRSHWVRRGETEATPPVTVGLCHFPDIGELDPGREDRYSAYRPRKGSRYRPNPAYEWLLHGHVHNAWTVNGKRINVGVDVWDFAPVAAETLLDIIRNGMPPCSCAGQEHSAGAPGCAVNGP
jgi:calcineurin-like phosphoesterase family protein